MTKLVGNLEQGIAWCKERLEITGQEVDSANWQSVASPDNTWETLDTSFKSPICLETDLARQTRCNQPWADKHFDERISGTPLNPGESFKQWPHFKHVGEQFKPDGKFSHTYMERLWPKLAGNKADAYYKNYPDWKAIMVGPDDGYKIHTGIRYAYGDLNSVVDLLVKDPNTRQAYIPIWFPEDTGVEHGERVPCTIGYWIIKRNGFLHITYYIRSCDIVRHFRDDVYLACKLLYWIWHECRKKDERWNNVSPGYLTMHIGSLHCFMKEKGLLKLAKT